MLLSILMLSAFHVHRYGPLAEDTCTECVNHLPHAGHLMPATASLHDCVLCQMCHVPFIMVAVLTLATPLTLISKTRPESSTHVAVRLTGHAGTRAPPVF